MIETLTTTLPQGAHYGVTEAQPAMAPRRVLIAEDDPTVRRLVEVVVEREGYTPVIACDGREAFRILQRDSDFALGIFDMMMPHLKGLDLILHMKTEKRLMKIPVMLMTAEQNPQYSADSLAAGAVVYLPKPFSSSQLKMLLQVLMKQAART